MLALNSMIVIIPSWEFRLVYPQEHHMKSRCLHKTKSCLFKIPLSSLFPFSCDYCTFPGRLWNPLMVLIWNGKSTKIKMVRSSARTQLTSLKKQKKKSATCWLVCAPALCLQIISTSLFTPVDTVCVWEVHSSDFMQKHSNEANRPNTVWAPQTL